MDKHEELFSQQIGGNHYSTLKYQPMVFAHKTNLPANILLAIRYFIRNKTNRKEDVLKGIDCVEKHLALCHEYGFVYCADHDKFNLEKELFLSENEDCFDVFQEMCFLLICDIATIPATSKHTFATLKKIVNIELQQLNQTN